MSCGASANPGIAVAALDQRDDPVGVRRLDQCGDRGIERALRAGERGDRATDALAAIVDVVEIGKPPRMGVDRRPEVIERLREFACVAVERVGVDWAGDDRRGDRGLQAVAGGQQRLTCGPGR